jgi:hypothetical protein
MPTTRASKIVRPPGADAALLKDFYRKATLAKETELRQFHAQFLRQSKSKAAALAPLVQSLGVDEKKAAQLLAKRRKAMRSEIEKMRPPKFKPLSSHNPARYAPYDFDWSYLNCGGISACKTYGPNAGTGEIGADLGIFNAGGASAGSAVGFWYYAQAGGTLRVTVNASVWGVGYVFSGLFGYASAWAGLRVYVQRYSPFTQWMAQSNIYDDWGVIEFDVSTFDFETRTVSISVPVVAHNWYAIWGDVHQSAYAGGIADSVSNFDLSIGPISYWLD